jgi:MAF protein
VLGKPADEEDAVRMLRALRGRPHVVYSAVTVLDVAAERAVSDVSASHVWMKDYGDAEIADYVASGDPLDKAGAYAIQHRGFAPVARIEGCYTGVMGLPLGHLARLLECVHVIVPVDVASACRRTTEAACCLADPAANPVCV